MNTEFTDGKNSNRSQILTDLDGSDTNSNPEDFPDFDLGLGSPLDSIANIEVPAGEYFEVLIDSSTDFLESLSD